MDGSLAPEEAKEYDQLYEKSKQKLQKCKYNAGKYGIADFSSQILDPDDFEPEDAKLRSKYEKKYKLDRNNFTDCKILENLDTEVEEFIVKNGKGSIRSRFQGDFLKIPLKEVLKKQKMERKFISKMWSV